MKKLLIICLVLLPLSVLAEVGFKAGINKLCFKNSSIETKPNYSMGIHYIHNSNKKYYFSFELLSTQFTAMIKNAPIGEYEAMPPLYQITFEDIDLNFSYLDFSLFLNYKITIPYNSCLNLYIGPTLSINTRTAASTKFIKQIMVNEQERSKIKYGYNNESLNLYKLHNSGWFYSLGFVVTRGIFDISARYTITFNEIDAPGIALGEQMSHVIYAFMGVHFD